MIKTTFEKIEPPADPATEHPAFRAARMIRDLHIQNIERIDGGLLFFKDGVDVSAEMREQCVVQIKLCDEIMARAVNMDPKHWKPAAILLSDIEKTVEEANASGDVLAGMLPELGNYDHEKS